MRASLAADEGAGMNKHTERLMAAFKSISAEADPYVAQGRLCEVACALLHCDRASLFLTDISTGGLLLQVRPSFPSAPRARGATGSPMDGVALE